jgi:hypothetical protein
MLKELVSRDWKGLQMVSLNRFEVQRIPVNLNVVSLNILEMALSHVRFSPAVPVSAFTNKSNRPEIQ